MAVKILVLLTFVMLLTVQFAASFNNNLRLDNLLLDTTLFRDIIKLARRAISGQCHCQQPLFNGDGLRRKKVFELAVQLEQLLQQESGPNVSDRPPIDNGLYADDNSVTSDEGKRVKRFHLNVRRRIAFPPGTKITMTPTFHLPFVRDMPDGLMSNMTLSFPFHISLDALGLTDDDNTFGTFPILRRIWNMIFKKRKQRSSEMQFSSRRVIYRTIENVLYSVGLAGRECLLRAICETHEYLLDERHGILGEALQLLFTASKSADNADAERLDYILAEKSGRERGECWQYYRQCSQSLFRLPGTSYDEYM